MLQEKQKAIAQGAAQGYNGSGKNSGTWRCTAPVPDIHTNTRQACGTTNPNSLQVCATCGASKNFNQSNKSQNLSKKEHTNMSNPTSTVKPSTSNKSNASPPPPTPTKATAPATTTASADTDASKSDKAKEVKNKRLKFLSVSEPSYYVRVRPELVKKFGTPRDFKGEEMKLYDSTAVTPRKVQKLEAKEQEQKLLAGMTDEQKMAYAKNKREQNQLVKAEKEKARKLQMMEELRAELEAKGLQIVPKDAVSSKS